jgi:hypothetical protein
LGRYVPRTCRLFSGINPRIERMETELDPEGGETSRTAFNQRPRWIVGQPSAEDIHDTMDEASGLARVGHPITFVVMVVVSVA